MKKISISLSSSNFQFKSSIVTILDNFNSKTSAPFFHFLHFFFFIFFLLLFLLISLFRKGEMERKLCWAVEGNNVEEVKEILRNNPNLDVNWGDDRRGGLSVLHGAGRNDDSPVLPILLAHPDIDVNLKDIDGWTPFCYACDGNTSWVREMLKDSRVKVNEPTDDGWTPLYRAAYNGHLDVIKWWIASGREMDFGEPGDVDKTDAIGVARKEGNTEVVNLLGRFKSDAAKTRSEVRSELGIIGEVAAPTAPELTKDEYLAFLTSHAPLVNLFRGSG